MPTRATLVAIACLLGCFSDTSLAGILWSIGTPDESSAEFKQWFHPTTHARQIDFTDPAQDSVFRPGVSSPSTDWLAYQPGDANGQAGFRPHLRSIEFTLDSLVAGEYFLDLHLLAYAARLPWLEIAVKRRARRLLPETQAVLRWR
ncbi:MAG: hypothetical protein FJ405_02505 [Verrucomicrobia bacterium]|nr:hypothetical protein [Verrucomicrobiota bacterium]